MRDIALGSLLALSLLCAFSVPTSASGRKEEKAQRQAFEQAKKTFLFEYRSADPFRRRAAVDALRPFADDGAVDLIVKYVLGSETNYGVLGAASDVLGRARAPKVVESLANRVTGSGDWRVRAPIAEALGSIPRPASRKAILTLLTREKDPRVLSMAIFSSASLDMKDAVEPVIRHLGDKAWQVRVSAIQALTEFRDVRALEPLIDRLTTERGRLRVDLAHALKKLTGMDFGDDVSVWRRWLKDRGTKKPLGPVGAAKPAKKPAKPDSSTSVAPDRPYYFGVPVASDRVLFVIDVSLSMDSKIDVGKRGRSRKTPITGPDRPVKKHGREKFGDQADWSKIKTRLDLAKAELAFTIKNLTDHQRFEIVAFSDTIKPWNAGHLVKANPLTKTKAIQFVDSLQVEGATATGKVLDWAFQMAGPGATDRNYKTGVDTIFFLSDGAPSDRPPYQILRDVKARNTLRKIRINVIAIVNQSVTFLRELAEQNKGIYKFFKVK